VQGAHYFLAERSYNQQHCSGTAGCGPASIQWRVFFFLASLPGERRLLPVPVLFTGRI
jgi:hypothetical protein